MKPDAELFPPEAVAMDSPRLAWMKRHDLRTFHTPVDGICESPETGDEIKPWTCCTVQELDRLSAHAIGTGNTEEEACENWALKHHVPTWFETESG